MAKLLVNLDAMIPRADFSVIGDRGFDADSGEKIQGIGVRDLEQGSLVLPNLRKPDFQRETNHWAPDQVVSLIQSYVDGDLIPSAILWKSPIYYFVIDGGHRLSALRAWIEDDYGDKAISIAFFGDGISDEQKRAAKITRKKINEVVGAWADWKKRNAMTTGVAEEQRRKISSTISRSITLQWVNGNADKAEESFYKINKQGTPLDEIEETLVRNRKKSVAIAARAVIRAGMGHKYWSSFPDKVREEIEERSKELHATLFQPEIKSPVKTLDLPLGGPAGVRQALAPIIDFILLANRNQKGDPKTIADFPDDDETGKQTIQALEKALRLARRMTGNQHGSLGLHPAVYFYGAAGRHSIPLFMGVATLIARKLVNNNSKFFLDFSKVRSELELVLINHKDVIAQVILLTRSAKRYDAIADLLEKIVSTLLEGSKVDDQSLVEFAGLKGKIVFGESSGGEAGSFSEDVKSKVFIKAALAAALKCKICGGYLDATKSVSYDHVDRLRDGGKGDVDNCQLTHPFCNQAVKN